MNATRWEVQIFLSESDIQTVADARLVVRGEEGLRGYGVARRNPADLNVPEIGDELAAARALSDLAEKLLHSAAADVEGVTHKTTHITS